MLNWHNPLLFFQYFPRVIAELSELQEFYDPDTVELMNWIKCVICLIASHTDNLIRTWGLHSTFLLRVLTHQPISASLPLFLSVPPLFLSFLSRTHAPMAAVFAGSPQLLGSVKLCSGWTVTSLPLYSDIDLLRRSEDVSRATWIIWCALSRVDANRRKHYEIGQILLILQVKTYLPLKHGKAVFPSHLFFPFVNPPIWNLVFCVK